MADPVNNVREDLNGTIARSRLSADVLDDLNESIKTITRAMLPVDVREDLNGTIPRWRLSADVLDDLNKTVVITPAVLLLSAFAPWVIQPLLMLGGLYLAFDSGDFASGRSAEMPSEVCSIGSSIAE